MQEAHDKGDSGHMQWLWDIADHSEVCLEGDGPTAESEALAARLDEPKGLLADKAYDADSLRKWLKQGKVKAVVPSTASRRTPYPLDSRAYKRRNLIERMFCKLKNWRRIATRYDRYAQNYLSGLALAAIMIAWI